MAVFLDTSFIVAFLNKKDSRNEKATKLWDKIIQNKWGYPVTSDYIVDECFTLLLTRRKNLDLLSNLHSFIHGDDKSGISKIIQFYIITQRIYENTWEMFKKYNDPELSFTDLTILEVCKELNIKYLASYDSDFEGKLAVLG
ncbi:MAG: type II toxin-antitoxin system VapC family toxin [Candidatus Hodarchaeales archaeon]|jgi:predicted nucleic acid-binding protein